MLDLTKYSHNPHVLTALLFSAVGATLKAHGREDLAPYVTAVALGKPGALVISTSSSLARAEIKLLTTVIIEGVNSTLAKFGSDPKLSKIAFRE